MEDEAAKIAANLLATQVEIHKDLIIRLIALQKYLEDQSPAFLDEWPKYLDDAQKQVNDPTSWWNQSGGGKVVRMEENKSKPAEAMTAQEVQSVSSAALVKNLKSKSRHVH